MFSVGAGSKVTVQVPSPLSDASGPPFASQPHQGPVRRTAAPSVVNTRLTPVGSGSGAAVPAHASYVSAASPESTTVHGSPSCSNQ